MNKSATWQDQGLFQLPLYSGRYLGYSGNADYGFDNVTLGWPGSGGPTLNHQVVTGFVSNDFYIGNLGLSPYPVNVTNFTSPFPSMLTTLRDDNRIPSLSYGYTAGASYMPIPRYGSLTFGGYDSTKAAPENVTVVMGADTNRDLILGISAITSGQDSLLPESIVAYIDSTVAQIWLPVSACERFESVFDLVWNEDSNLYPVNDTLHDKLVAMNPNITLSLSNGLANSEQTIDIKLPYASFDLRAGDFFIGNITSRYFPLRRAQNSSQYTLGRTFLQEAYLTVDYDRSSFSVSQVLFPDPGVPAKLVPILAPNATDVSPVIPARKLSKSIVAGIFVAIVSALVILGLVWYFLHRHIKGKRKHPSPASARPDAELSSPEIETKRPQNAELDAQITEFRGYEVDGEEYCEMGGEGGETYTPEMSAQDGQTYTPEVSGEVIPLEMPAHPIYEMGGGWEGSELAVPKNKE
ncbi:MAG: hypothetical protein Q9187_004365 [Circinaria calcarea]